MSDFAIRFEDVSKNYRIGRPRAFTTAFANMLGKMRGRETGRAQHFALSHVSFEVEKGASVGMVGANGAGKTTILKLLSRVTWPTSGRVLVAGRVISLIELGAGFHPELTGEENIYLHGAILGISKSDLAKSFHNVVEFAGIEKFVDTPVKWYSSGMYARLGFSVAAFSEPDVLLVDEVLAVGDTAFQRRAIDKMREFVGTGRTVVLVSHDLANVRGLCRDVIWLDKGQIRAQGETEEVIAQYLDHVNEQAASEVRARDRTEMRGGSGEVRYTGVELLDDLGNPRSVFSLGEPLRIRARYEALQAVDRPLFRIAITSPAHGVTVCIADTQTADIPERVDEPGEIECRFEALPLRPGQYSVQLYITGSELAGLYDALTLGETFVVSAANVSAEHGFAAGQSDLVHIPFEIKHRAGAVATRSA
jgi:ABC-type polysaccharide/polyol phosphate transport system ATPase subunit